MTDHRSSLVLASASSRRRDLLQSMGCIFSVQVADIDESQREKESALDYVTRLAQEKALAVLERQQPADHKVAILAADTIVTKGDTIFGKPRDRQQAFQYWSELADSQHDVMTAVCLADRDKIEVKLVRSMVAFGSIEESQMYRYWLSGEPRDKAGAYAIQGLASAWVKFIHGSYSNVVGLPLRETNELLRKVGHNWL